MMTPTQRQMFAVYFHKEVGFPVWFIPRSPVFWNDFQTNASVRMKIYKKDCSVKISPEFSDVNFCAGGCYQKDQNLLFFSNGKKEWKQIQEAYNKEKFVMTLSKEANLSHLSYEKSEVSYYMKDAQKKKRALLEFTMASGRTLAVTPDHPLVDEQGMIREAMNFSLKNALIDMNGSLDPIVKMKHKMIFDRVYNLDTKAEHKNQRIVLANGYLNGTYWYETYGKQMLSKINDRENLMKNLRSLL
jgi:hypothetical protein